MVIVKQLTLVLIPTLYKTKLSREFSYPLGAELLSEHVLGIARFSDFRICFSDVVTAWKSKFQQMIAEGADYAIIVVRLWEPWEIYVYPVQRGLKHWVHESLVSQGLPLLRDWILRHQTDSPLREASCKVMLSPSSEIVYLRERVSGKERDLYVA